MLPVIINGIALKFYCIIKFFIVYIKIIKRFHECNLNENVA